MLNFFLILTIIALPISETRAQDMLVDLSGKNITRIPDSILCRASQITELKLGGGGLVYTASVVPVRPFMFSAEGGYNNISTLGPEMAKFVNLKSIDLSFNSITSLPDEFYSLSKLESLSLAFAERFDLALEALKLAQLRNLKSLDLLGTRFTIFPKELASLDSLEVLSVGNSKVVVDEAFVERIGELSSLKELYLIDVGMSTLPSNLYLLKRLEILTVTLSPLKHVRAAISGLQKMNHLSTIRFSAVPLDLTQISELNEALPGVKIEFNSEGAPEN